MKYDREKDKQELLDCEQVIQRGLSLDPRIDSLHKLQIATRA